MYITFVGQWGRTGVLGAEGWPGVEGRREGGRDGVEALRRVVVIFYWVTEKNETVKHLNMHISFTYKVRLSTNEYKENQKSPLQTECISWDLTFENNRQTHSLPSKETYFGDKLLSEEKCKKWRRKLREMTTTYCRNILEGKKCWKQIVKLVPCSRVNNLNNQKSEKDFVQSWGQWGTSGKSCVLVELLRAKSGAHLDLRTKYFWAWHGEI